MRWRTSHRATVDVRSVEKLQEGSYTGITISPAGGNVGMNLNANQLFDQMQDGQSYEGVLAVAVSTAERGLHDMPAVDVSELMNYEAAKKYLCFDVVGSDRNADMLEKVPHTDKENISMVYRLQLDSTENGAATVLITNAMMEQFGVTKEQLHADAMENAQEIRPADFRTMAAVMAEMMGMPEEMMADMAPPMYVATNQDKVQGAAVMFYPDFMDQAAKELGGDIFILPSSVHEVLILPDDGNMNAQELKEMVTSINASEVSPEDRLTDSVYHYDAQERIFELGEKFEERQAEKMAAKEERSSVLKDLQDKKQDMDLKPKTPTPHKSKNEQSIG